ncbi:dihydrofolate reductase family protein [Paradesertivirga mongoliensis]|uniref:Dihydrofolate reductase family protein n=1 Tax=Paradesertivirga mongoliensis TaxID=2100740 RepID=A0ABW4ZN47_9SPHI|nr:dihydrofolate reductase family protein [Pedobacter mongoliensis]
MRKIIVTTNITLDGVMQGMGGPNEDASGGFEFGGWSVPHADEVSGKAVKRYMDANAEYLLGRKTFEIFYSVWPQRADMWPQITEGTKYVFSNTLEKSDWKNTVFLNKLEDLKKLKNSNGVDIHVWGSSELIQLLLENDLVDELHLRIHPVILGEGKKLFKEGRIATELALTESEITEKGVILAYYNRTGEVRTGTYGA